MIKEALSSVTLDDLDRPISETGIDSLDLILIRVALEEHYGVEISDSDWYKYRSLREAHSYFLQAGKQSDRPTFKEDYCNIGGVHILRNCEIGMPQMAIKALSELWLLKELGDIHWQLISNGLQQKSSEFCDGLGNRLYATFVRIHYTLNPLCDFKEDSTLTLNGSIRRYGNDAYLSEINGETNSCFLDAQLMTCFSQRETQSNSKILKGVLKENLNYIEKTNSSPEFLNQYRFLRKNLINEIEHNDFKFSVTDEEVAVRIHNILPYYEINGVGLLYFACYPIISDTEVSDIIEALGIVPDFKMRYFTIFRDIFYFANCDVNDKVIVKLNDIELLVNDCIKYSTSLYRESDNALMSRIFTVKKLCTESCQ